jgi:mono/diheme cytochrome c family protein
LKLNVTRTVIVCIAAAIAVPALAQGSAADTYKADCLMCHGADGTGNTPAGKAFKAASFKDPMVTTKSNEELATIIKSGKDKMPSFKDKLTDAQIKALLAYIRKLSK